MTRVGFPAEAKLFTHCWQSFKACFLVVFAVHFQGVMQTSALRLSNTYQLYYNVYMYSVLMLIIPWTIIVFMNAVVILRVNTDLFP